VVGARVLRLPLPTKPIIQRQLRRGAELILDKVTHIPGSLARGFARFDLSLIHLPHEEACITETRPCQEIAGKAGLRGLKSEMTIGDVLRPEICVPAVEAAAEFDCVLSNKPADAFVQLPVRIALALLAHMVTEKVFPWIAPGNV